MLSDKFVSLHKTEDTVPYADLAVLGLPPTFTDWVLNYRNVNGAVLPPISNNPLSAVADEDDRRPIKRRKTSALV